MQHFKDLNLAPSIQINLDALNFTEPTPIQAQTIPLALQGLDILGSAQTGTGKTLAFSVPLVSYILNNPTQSALVLTPTRELAQQVFKTICTLIPRGERICGSLLIGGESFSRQLSQLRREPRIIVATPGRMIDHFEQGTVDGSKFSFLVLDETDRMFDMGFSIQLESIIKRLPRENRQTLMFSATMAPEIEHLTKKYLKNPTRISVDSSSKPVTAIAQETFNLKETEKYDRLLNELTEREGSVIIFVKTKRSAEILADNLDRDGHEAECIHGDLRQNKRERVMTAFRKGRYRIMVATDIAARGLDVPHIKLVVNYDLPQCPEDYIHRIGRTGRAGAEGSAINFVAGHDKRNWDAIQRLMNPEQFKGAPKFSPQRSFGGGSGSRDRRGGGFSSSRNSNRDSYGNEIRGDRDSKPRRSYSNDGDFSPRGNESRSGDFSSSRGDFSSRAGSSEYSRGERSDSRGGSSSFGGQRRSSGSGFDNKRKPFNRSKNIQTKSY